MNGKSRALSVAKAADVSVEGWLRFIKAHGLYLRAARSSFEHAGSWAYVLPGVSHLWTETHLYQLSLALTESLDPESFIGLWWQNRSGDKFEWHPWRLVGFLDNIEARFFEEAFGQTKRRRSGIWRSQYGERNRIQLRIPHR